MRKPFALALVGTPLLLFPLALSARAEPTPALRLETLVPKTTLAFAALEDVGAWTARWKETAIGRLAADPEMRAFFQPIEEDLRAMMKAPPKAKGEKEDGKEEENPFERGFHVPPLLLEAFEQLNGLSGQVGVALASWPKEGTPAVDACLDFGTHLSDFVTFLKRVEAELGKSGDKDGAGKDDGGAGMDKGPGAERRRPFSSEERGGRTWWTLAGPDEKTTVQATTVGTAVFVSTDPAWLAAVVASNAAPLKDSLAESDAFVRVLARAGGPDVALFAFANAPEILERVPMKDKARSVANALGLDTVRGAGYGCAFKGDGFLDTLVVDAPKADHGLTTLFETTPVTHRALGAAPSTALLYAESGVRFSSLLPKVRDVVSRVAPEDLKKFDDGIQKANETLGLDLQKDLLAGLADETAVWIGLPETGGLYPEVAFSIAVKDPAAFETTLGKAVDGIAARLAKDGEVVAAPRVLEYHGKRLHVLDLSSAKHDVVPFTPTWAMLDGRLVLTLVPHAMKEIVLRLEAKEAGLAGEEDVRSLLRVAPEGHGAFEYADLQAVAGFLYDTAVPLAQTAAKPNLIPIPLHLDWAQLPATRTVRPYLRSLALFLTSDDEGLRISVHSPLPALPLLATAAAAAAGVAMTRHHGAMDHEMRAIKEVEGIPHGRGLAQADLAKMQAKWMSDALAAYALDHGHLPERLDQLLDPSSSKEPYIQRLPLDPWGQPYAYEITDAAANTYRVSSAGPDKTLGTPDDVIWPEPAKPSDK